MGFDKNTLYRNIPLFAPKASDKDGFIRDDFIRSSGELWTIALWVRSNDRLLRQAILISATSDQTRRYLSDMPHIAYKICRPFSAVDKGVYYAVNHEEIRLWFSLRIKVTAWVAGLISRIFFNLLGRKLNTCFSFICQRTKKIKKIGVNISVETRTFAGARCKSKLFYVSCFVLGHYVPQAHSFLALPSRKTDHFWERIMYVRTSIRAYFRTKRRL